MTPGLKRVAALELQLGGIDLIVPSSAAIAGVGVCALGSVGLWSIVCAGIWPWGSPILAALLVSSACSFRIVLGSADALSG